MDIEAYISSGIIESYVLGMADAQEILELEQLKSTHPEIKAAIDSFEASLEATALSNAVAPNPDTKSKLMFALKDEFAAVEATPNTENIKEATPTKDAKVVSLPLKPSVPSHQIYKYAAVAAAVLLVISSSLDVYFYRKYYNTNKQVVALLTEKNVLTSNNATMQAKYQEITSSLQLMSDTNITKVAMRGIAGKEGNLATVFWDNKTKDVFVYTNKLPKAPEGKQYQLWALVNGKPIDAGVLDDCNGVCKLKNTQKADIFAITLEKKGGSATPDLSQLYVLGKVNS